MGIWLINYEVLKDGVESYLDWFHDIHMGEKLARPGYDWAAHYQMDSMRTDRHRYMAIFGAKTSRVFYDPSPAQLKVTQDDLTREMIVRRLDVNSFIATQEWTNGAATPVSGEFVSFTEYDSQQDDQSIASWLAQVNYPEISKIPGSLSQEKYLSSTGQPRHFGLLEFETRAALEIYMAGTGLNESAGKIAEQYGGRRIWPRMT